MYFGINRASPAAMEVGKRLYAERKAVERELGLPVKWEVESDGKVRVSISRHYWPLRDPAKRQEQLEWFRSTINAFINALRPRAIKLWREIHGSLAGTTG